MTLEVVTPENFPSFIHSFIHSGWPCLYELGCIAFEFHIESLWILIIAGHNKLPFGVQSCSESRRA